jgi:hypothetical protein
MVFVPADRSGWRVIWARGRQEKLVNRFPVAIAPPKNNSRRQRASPSFRSGTAQAPPVARSGSARFRRARWLTRQFATGSSPARYIAQASFRSLPCARPQTCRDSQGKNPCAPKVAVSKVASPAPTLVAALLARLEPSLRFRFSLIALGGQREKMAARLRPARKLLARDASHGQDAALSVRPASFWSLR